MRGFIFKRGLFEGYLFERGLIQIGLGYLRRALFELNLIREGFIQREPYLKGYCFKGALIGVEIIRKTYFKGALF